MDGSPPKRDMTSSMPNTPSNESADENLEVLHFYSKVDEGLRQLDAGESIEHEEALKRMKKWLD